MTVTNVSSLYTSLLLPPPNLSSPTTSQPLPHRALSYLNILSTIPTPTFPNRQKKKQ
jgi:hypothetical protein